MIGDDDDAWDDGDDQPVAGSTTHDNDALDDGGDQPMADTSTHGDEMVNNEMDGDEDVEFDDEGDEIDEESESATHILSAATLLQSNLYISRLRSGRVVVPTVGKEIQQMEAKKKHLPPAWQN